MHIVTVIGTRPQFVKAAVVSGKIADHNRIHPPASSDHIREIIIHTGQHYDPNMSEIFFQEMGIPAPHHRLNAGGLSHGAMTGRMLEEIEKILLQEHPEFLLVYGDTNSTLAAALAAAKLEIPIAHVEAGLRSWNRSMPEELNRILTDQLSSLLFCPTLTAVDNLQREGFQDGPCTGSSQNQKIVLCGDVMLDASLRFRDLAETRATILKKLSSQFPRILQEGQPSFHLCTLHRAENTDNPARLQAICNALAKVAQEMPIILPCHPRLRQALAGIGISNIPSILLTEPLGYLDMVQLLTNCRLVLTDSGGLQKEAYFFRKPCITLRDETEWLELVEHRCNLLAGASQDRILAAVSQAEHIEVTPVAGLYGDGNAGGIIVRELLAFQKTSAMNSNHHASSKQASRLL